MNYNLNKVYLNVIPHVAGMCIMCPKDQISHEAPKLFEVFMKKGVGFFIVAVLTSFSITGVIEYVQVSFDFLK